MRKFLILCLLLSNAGKVFSQADTSVQHYSLKTDYLKKSKTQKTIAWTMLGAGTVMVVAGVVTAGNADSNPYPLPIPPTDKKFYNGAALIATGLILDLVSIPFFISGAKNKGRAMSVTMRNDLVPQLQKNARVSITLPTVRLVIRL